MLYYKIKAKIKEIKHQKYLVYLRKIKGKALFENCKRFLIFVALPFLDFSLNQKIENAYYF